MILKPETAKAIEKNFELTDKAWKLLKLIVAEFESDPKSVQCFDLRVVNEAIEVVKERKKIEPKLLMPYL